MGRGGSDGIGAATLEESLPRSARAALCAEGFRFYRGGQPPVFAQQSESMIAELLERFEIPWQYEPHTFALSQYEDGAVKEAFSPDFYLPEQNAYIEVTVMRAEYRNRKNRKIRMAKEQHGIKVLRCYTRQLKWLADRYDFDPDVFASHAPMN